MKEKYLFFQNAANDCNVYPLSKLINVEAASTALNLTFDTIAGEDLVVLTVTADEHQAMVDLATAFGGPVHSDGVLVIADDANSTYIIPAITGVATAA
tara:strand:+ start:322 stop:615 length:294 start_codon:yes stop_codon:yes gene_type:complete